MMETLADVRRWLRWASSHGRIYYTVKMRKEGRPSFVQFYTCTPRGLVRLAPMRPKDPFQRTKLRGLGWNQARDAWIAEFPEKLLTEAASSLGWREFSVEWEALR